MFFYTYLAINFGNSSFELYNWKEDYEEKDNLVNEKAEVREELKKAIKAHMQKNKPSMDSTHAGQTS